MPQPQKQPYARHHQPGRHVDQHGPGRDITDEEADRRAWAMANGMNEGGKKSSSGRGQKDGATPHPPGRPPAGARTFLQRSLSAKKAAQTRARNQAQRRQQGD